MAGGMLDTFPQVAELRQKILDLWTGAFQTDDTSAGGCPAVPSANAADPPATAAAFGVETLRLFVQDEAAAADLYAQRTR